jgi:hypothetical protein
LSTVTPGKLPTFWLSPVRTLNSELLPLLGLPTKAIVYGRGMEKMKNSIDCILNADDADIQNLFSRNLSANLHLVFGVGVRFTEFTDKYS